MKMQTMRPMSTDDGCIFISLSFVADSPDAPIMTLPHFYTPD